MGGVGHLAHERSKAEFDVDELKIVWAGSRHTFEISDRIALVASDPINFEKYKQHRSEKEWLYFTLRDQNHKEGNYEDRIVKDNFGFWRRTKSEQVVRSDSGEIVGFKNKFVFHKGEPSNSEKTNWFMEEYIVLD